MARRLVQSIPWDSQAELELLQHHCRKDFWSFFLYAFGAGSNPKGERWIDPNFHEPLAKWFQKHVDEWFEKRQDGRGEQKHLAVVIPRECGKTTMITQAGQLWLHLRDPELSSYTGCEKTELSMKILEGMKAVMDGSDPYALFPKLYGNWATGSRKWTGKEIIHGARKNTSRKDPSLGTFAVETSIVGAHPDAWFEDDPISYERLTTDTHWLATVNSQVTSMEPVIQSDGLIVWPGTRYDEDDHYGIDFRERGVATIEGMETDSIQTDSQGVWHVFFWSARDKNNQVTVPKIWPERRLHSYQRRDPLRYAAQVLNDPSISESNPITKDQIKQCVVESKDVPWNSLRFAITTDTAFSDGTKVAGKDDTVFIVHGYPRNGSGDVYVVEAHGSNQWRAEDFAHRLVATVQRYRKQGRKVFAITDEKTMAGKKGAWELSLRNFFHDANEPMPNFLEFVRGGTKKVTRLVSATSFWVDGHVRVVKDAPGVDKLMEQMAKIGQYMVNQKLKIDYADAHSDAFEPELYQPMKRVGPQRAPYERGATAVEMDGIDPDNWDDSWKDQSPRPPVKGLY